MNERIAPMLLAATLAAIALPAAALAQSQPQPQRVISRGVPDRVRPQSVRAALATAHTNDRTLYGRIDAMKASLLLVRSRSGRLVRVDGSDAIRSGTYSAPLFVGKLVVVTGYYDAARTLHAQTITRETRLDARTGPDR